MLKQTLLFIILLNFYAFALAAETIPEKPLADSLQTLKAEILELNKDLSILEEKLLYPNTQLSVFLSVNVGTPIRLIDVNINIDENHAAYHYYTDEQYAALTRGAVHRLHMGNIGSGSHVLSVNITGYEPSGKSYKKTATYTFRKNTAKKLIEIKVVDNVDTLTHQFKFKEWDAK